MNLLNLRQNFQTLQPNEQVVFLNEYVAKRVIDLEKTAIIKPRITAKKGVKRTKEKKIPVTIEQLELLKKLGLV